MTSKPRALLVEDSATNRKLIARMLEAYGCVVTPVTTGREAVDSLAGGNPHGFDIILMDIEMPDMNGMEASRAIRRQEAAQPDTPRVPIIALTANDRPEQVARYFAAGMDAHISKPIDWAKLAAAIEVLTRDHLS